MHHVVEYHSYIVGQNMCDIDVIKYDILILIVDLIFFFTERRTLWSALR